MQAHNLVGRRPQHIDIRPEFDAQRLPILARHWPGLPERALRPAFRLESPQPSRLPDELVTAMTPAEVESIVVACMAALERHPRRARPELIGEGAACDLRREALDYAAKRTVAVTDWMAGLGIPRDLTGIEMLRRRPVARPLSRWSWRPNRRRA